MSKRPASKAAKLAKAGCLAVLSLGLISCFICAFLAMQAERANGTPRQSIDNEYASRSAQTSPDSCKKLEQCYLDCSITTSSRVQQDKRSGSTQEMINNVGNLERECKADCNDKYQSNCQNHGF